MDNTSLLPSPFCPGHRHRPHTWRYPTGGKNHAGRKVELGQQPQITPAWSRGEHLCQKHPLPDSSEVTVPRSQCATSLLNRAILTDSAVFAKLWHLKGHKHLVCLFVFPLVFTICFGHLQHLGRISVWFVACKRA